LEYGLSLKLQKFSNAIPYVKKQLARHCSIYERCVFNLDKLRKGDIAAIFNVTTSQEFISRLLKKDPGIIDRQIKAALSMISDAEVEISKFRTIMDALRNENRELILGLVDDTEVSSREYLMQRFLHD